MLLKLRKSTEKAEININDSLAIANKLSTNYSSDRTIINYYYTEIVNHLNEIKHHIERIHYHHSKVMEIRRISLENAESIKDTQNEYISTKREDVDAKIPLENAEISAQNESASTKREDCDTISKCARKVLRTSSMKYLEQWEKMVEAQKAEIREENIEPYLPLLPKSVIKKRVRQFEGRHKKRASSTVEAFLDEESRYSRTINEILLEEDEEESTAERICNENDRTLDVATTKTENIIYNNDEISNNSIANSNKPAVTTKPRIVDVVVSIFDLTVRNYIFNCIILFSVQTNNTK